MLATLGGFILSLLAFSLALVKFFISRIDKVDRSIRNDLDIKIQSQSKQITLLQDQAREYVSRDDLDREIARMTDILQQMRSDNKDSLDRIERVNEDGLRYIRNQLNTYLFKEHINGKGDNG